MSSSGQLGEAASQHMDTDTEDEAAPAAPWAAPPDAFPPEVGAAQLTAEAKEEATEYIG